MFIVANRVIGHLILVLLGKKALHNDKYTLHKFVPQILHELFILMYIKWKYYLVVI